VGISVFSLWNLEAPEVSSISVPPGCRLSPARPCRPGWLLGRGERREVGCVGSWWQMVSRGSTPTLHPLVSATTTDPTISPTRAYLCVQGLWPQNSEHKSFGDRRIGVYINCGYAELTLLLVSPLSCEFQSLLHGAWISSGFRIPGFRNWAER
jgi:hypothetical protein